MLEALETRVTRTKVGRLLRRWRRLNYCLLSEIWKLIIVPARRSLSLVAAPTVHLTAAVATATPPLSSWSRAATELSKNGVVSLASSSSRFGLSEPIIEIDADRRCQTCAVRRQTRVCIPRRRRRAGDWPTDDRAQSTRTHQLAEIKIARKLAKRAAPADSDDKLARGKQESLKGAHAVQLFIPD